MPNRTELNNRINNERGATAVEFAVVAALLFVILIGILEFGFIFLQEHLVANAAREGVRIGVTANNFDSITQPYDEDSDPGSSGSCYTLTDRAMRIHCEVRDYLWNTIYVNREPRVIVDVEPDDPNGDPRELRVTVSEDNIFPPLLSAFVSALPGIGDFNAPDAVSYTASGDYEDPDEN